MDRLELLFTPLENWPFFGRRRAKPPYLQPVTFEKRCGTCHTQMEMYVYVLDCCKQTTWLCPSCGKTWPPVRKATFLVTMNQPP